MNDQEKKDIIAKLDALIEALWLDIEVTEKKKEENSNEIRYGDTYFYVDEEGDIVGTADRGNDLDKKRANFGNRFNTRHKAQIVSDLRKHVMKFPAFVSGCMVLALREREWFETRYRSENGINIVRNKFWLPITATEEDRAERLRLIQEADRLDVLQFC